MIQPYFLDTRTPHGEGRAQHHMQVTPTQKKAIDHYYQELAAYQEKKVTRIDLCMTRVVLDCLIQSVGQFVGCFDHLLSAAITCAY